MNNEKLNLPLALEKIFGYWKPIVASLFVMLILWLSIFQISTEEVGVITRFGKYVRQVEPGLSLKIPFAEDVYKVPVERQQKLEFGFRTVKAGVDTEYGKSSNPKDESLMLTGDLNLAEVQWVVQYRVDNAYKNLFKVRNPQSTLRIISEAAMRQIVGDRTVNEVLTVGRTEIGIKLNELIQQICREYSMGIKIEQVVLQDVNPPEPVKAAFNAVNEAQQEKETLINQAKSEYNKVIPKARGQAKETIQQAEGYAAQRVNNADGEAARFTALYQEFLKAPEVTKRRIYLETMSNVLPKIGNVVITDQKGNNVLPLLQMQMNKKTVNNEN
jgi:membrane protease subunit HflK